MVTSYATYVHIILYAMYDVPYSPFTGQCVGLANFRHFYIWLCWGMFAMGYAMVSRTMREGGVDQLVVVCL